MLIIVAYTFSVNQCHCCPPVVDRSTQSGQHISPYQTKSGLQKIPPIASLLLSSTTCCNMYSSCSMSRQVYQCVSFCNNLHSKMDVRVIFLWNKHSALFQGSLYCYIFISLYLTPARSLHHLALSVTDKLTNSCS